MMFCLNHIKSLNMAHFSAPLNRSIKPRKIPQNAECLEILTGGKVYFEFNGQEQEFSFGTIFWHNTGEYTIHKYDPPNPYSCLMMQFKVNTYPGRQVPRVTQWENHESLNFFVAEMTKAFYDDGVDREFLCRYAYSRALWEAYISTCRRTKSSLPLPVQRMIEYIDKSFAKDLMIEDMAKAAGISAPYLYAISQKHLGRSPHQYLIDRRLNEAKRLLTVSYHSIKKISYDCGFMNVETFCRSFKKNFNMTPGQYRNKHSIMQIS